MLLWENKVLIQPEMTCHIYPPRCCTIKADIKTMQDCKFSWPSVFSVCQGDASNGIIRSSIWNIWFVKPVPQGELNGTWNFTQSTIQWVKQTIMCGNIWVFLCTKHHFLYYWKPLYHEAIHNTRTDPMLNRDRGRHTLPNIYRGVIKSCDSSPTVGSHHHATLQ